MSQQPLFVPASDGWYARPGDPPGVLRHWNGKTWQCEIRGPIVDHFNHLRSILPEQRSPEDQDLLRRLTRDVSTIEDMVLGSPSDNPPLVPIQAPPPYIPPPTASYAPPPMQAPMYMGPPPMAQPPMGRPPMPPPPMAPQQMAPQPMAPQPMPPQQMAPQQMPPQMRPPLPPQPMPFTPMAPPTMAPQPMPPQPMPPQQMAMPPMASQSMPPQSIATPPSAPRMMPPQMAMPTMAPQPMAPQSPAPYQPSSPMGPQSMATPPTAPQQPAPQPMLQPPMPQLLQQPMPQPSMPQPSMVMQPQPAGPPKSSSPTKKGASRKILLVAIPVLVVLLAVGGYAFRSKLPFVSGTASLAVDSCVTLATRSGASDAHSVTWKAGDCATAANGPVSYLVVSKLAGVAQCDPDSQYIQTSSGTAVDFTYCLMENLKEGQCVYEDEAGLMFDVPCSDSRAVIKIAVRADQGSGYSCPTDTSMWRFPAGNRTYCFSKP